MVNGIILTSDLINKNRIKVLGNIYQIKSDKSTIKEEVSSTKGLVKVMGTDALFEEFNDDTDKDNRRIFRHFYTDNDGIYKGPRDLEELTTIFKIK